MSNEDSNEQAPVSVLFDHAKRVYDAMFERSFEHDPGDGSRVMVIYEGTLTRLITKDLLYSVPYYTTITAVLKKMNCIKQLKRGGGAAASQWELITAPTLEKFVSLSESDPKLTKTTGRTDRVTRREFDELSQRVRDLTKTVTERL